MRLADTSSSGEAVYRFVVRSIASAVPAGGIATLAFEELALPFGRWLWQSLKARPALEQQRMLQAIADMPYDTSYAIADAAWATVDVEASARAAVVGRLAATPMAVRGMLGASGAMQSQAGVTLLTRVPDPVEVLARLVPSEPPLFTPGHVLGDLRLETLIGQGGVGEVWRATSTVVTSAPPVAVKFCRNPELSKLLRRETLVLDKLGQDYQRHGIAELKWTDLERDPPYIVYEYVAGGSLADWVALYDGPIPLATLTSMLRKIATPLAFAHRCGVQHRDLKPSNILIGADKEVKLSDFGIGMVAGEEQLRSGVTIVRNAGTPLYQDVYGRSSDGPSPLQDVYAFGVLSYQLLIRDLTRPAPPAWRTHVEEVRREPLDARLAAVVDGCLSSPAKRFSNGEAILQALDKVFVAETRQPPDPLPTAEPEPIKHLRPDLKPLLGPAAVVGASVLGFLVGEELGAIGGALAGVAFYLWYRS